MGSVGRLTGRAATLLLCPVRAAHGGLPVSARPRRLSTTPPTPPASRGAALAEAARVRATQHSTPMAAYLTALVVGMVGATYGSVPLYRLFCQATGAQGAQLCALLVDAAWLTRTARALSGFGGTTQRVSTVGALSSASVASTREVVVTFNADVSDSLPWRFTPAQPSLVLRPGESTLAFYTATNLCAGPVTGVATYNVTPQRAGLYFNKVQCFCFEEQRLEGGESLDMPVLFYLDPQFDEDPRCASVNTITLSYTFFRVDGAEENRREAQQALQASAAGGAQAAHATA